MNADELIAIGQIFLEFGREQLEREGRVEPAFNIVFADHQEIHVVADPRLMSSRGKSRVRNEIKARVRAGAEAVMTLADVWMSRDLTPETTPGSTLKQAVDAGLGTATKNVVVSIESPLLRWIAAREYRCHDREKRIEWVGETKIITGDRVITGGDFAPFFPASACESPSAVN